MNRDHFDYIIAGGGMSGLSLAIKMIQNPFFQKKKILILEQSAKTENDRTWSFWKRKRTPFDSIIYKSWSQIIVKNEEYNLKLDLTPYQYNTIRGIDFYKFCKKVINGSTIDYRNETIQSISPDGQIQTLQSQYTAELIFNSTSLGINFRKNPKDLLLWQHFKGEVIRTNHDFFDDSVATFMDFTTPQVGETRFFYMLPFSKKEALIEYTVFSKNRWEEADYDPFLTEYKQRLQLPQEHTITETEFNAIPMTDHIFPERQGKILHIGTSGGFIKGSSGYAFMPTQRKLDQILDQIQRSQPLIRHRSAKKFLLYDAILLRALNNPDIRSDQIFVNLFKEVGAPNLFTFLDEETHLLEDLRVISAVPNRYKAAFARHLPLWFKLSG